MTLPPQAPDSSPLPLRSLARVNGWGMAVGGLAWRMMPGSTEELVQVFETARRHGLSVGLRGAGRSYGDAANNTGGIVLDVSRLDRILEWNPAIGRMVVEPGATIEHVWKRALPDGWWPAVVSGTMHTTVGGCAAMNIHGKNNMAAGPFGDCIESFRLMVPNGVEVEASRTENEDLFHAAIGGFGMLGVFTRLTLQLKRIHSGQLSVEARHTPNLAAMIECFDECTDTADYLVGWVDGTARGRALGRGFVHLAYELAKGDDPAATFDVESQGLPRRLMGFFPAQLAWWPLSYFTNPLGMRVLNAGKYWITRLLEPDGHRYRQSHAAFSFLLDYVPNWRRAYLPGGLIQYQCFVPDEAAVEVFETLLKMSHRVGMPPFLGVTKRHRADDYWMSHALDGYSLALDYRVVPAYRDELWRLCRRMDEVVLDAGGKFYFAKDATLDAASIDALYPAETLEAFASLKQLCDPECLLQTDLARRLGFIGEGDADQEMPIAAVSKDRHP